DEVQAFGPANEPFMRIEPWLRTGHSQRLSLSVSGGRDDSNYFLSGSFQDVKGVLPVDREERWSLRTNFGMAPHEDVRIDFNSSFSTADLRNTPVGNGPYSLPLSASRAPINYIGSDRKEDIDRLIEEFELTTAIERLVLGVTARHQITPELDHRFTLGMDNATNDLRNV